MSDATPKTFRTPIEVTRACLAAHKAKDWAKLRTALHPEALIATFSGGGRPEDPELALNRLRDAHEDFIYHANVSHLVELDDQAVLLYGRVQYEIPTAELRMSDAAGCTSSVTNSSTEVPSIDRSLRR